jgi:hypothetical protein
MHKFGRRPRATERDLAHLADGTLDPGRGERVERSVADSHELQARLRDQRRAVAAMRTLGSGRAPLALRLRRRALSPPPRPRSRLLGLGLASVLGAVALMFATLGGGHAGLTAADAATLAASPPTASVAEPVGDAATLPSVSAAGLPFPYWEDHFGWVATGVRRDSVDGRLLTTVFYSRDGRRIAYTIVPGTRLPDARGAETIKRGGIVVHAFADDGRLIVTWLRRGHTCVLSGSDVSLGELTALAASRSPGGIPY